MSYEGYEEHLCKNGHRFSIDATWNYGGFLEDDRPECPHCKEKSVWVNCVDETNAMSDGMIPEEVWAKFVIEPAVTKTCECCNHTEVVSQARYRLPTKAEKKKMTTYYDGIDDVYKWHWNGEPVKNG